MYLNLTFLFLFNVTALNHLNLEIGDAASLVPLVQDVCIALLSTSLEVTAL